MMEFTEQYKIRADIQKAAAIFSRYARCEGPVPPGAWHCPLTYGIPATGDIIDRLNGRGLGLYDPPLRRQVRAVQRKLDKEITTITEYATWLQACIDRRPSESYGRALCVAKAFLNDLSEANTILTDVAERCPKSRKR